jgi:hypothetical protein
MISQPGSLKQTSTGEATQTVAARGLILFRHSSPALNSLSEQINTFDMNLKVTFIETLNSTLEYAQAHAVVHSTCQKFFNDIKFSLQTHTSTQDQTALQKLQQRVICLSRSIGPPPLHRVVTGTSCFRIRHVPADNSCLFHCFQRLYRGQESTQELRQQCCQYVKAHKDELSMTAGEEFVTEYATSMGRDTTWGSAFEIFIQCQLRRCRIVLFDVVSRNEQTFNCEDGIEPLTVAYLIRVDGNHFDYLAWTSDSGQDDRQVFSIWDEIALRRSRRVVRQVVGDRADEVWRIDGKETSKPMLRQASWQ